MFWKWLYWQVDASTITTWVIGDTMAYFLYSGFMDPD